jgi:hypothetical protein
VHPASAVRHRWRLALVWRRVRLRALACIPRTADQRLVLREVT